ncbi:MAG TPA: hypothetical protein DCK98_01255 [Chloroflexi bacterium]|nr:hypothetical protein [Chloroflexota bacterium]
MGFELSMREPTVLITGLELTCSGAEGFAALAGCDAIAKESTTAVVKAHLITRIYAPLPAGPGRTVAPRWLDHRGSAGVVTRTRGVSSTD